MAMAGVGHGFPADSLFANASLGVLSLGDADHSPDKHPDHAVEEAIPFEGERNGGAPLHYRDPVDRSDRALRQGSGISAEAPEIVRSLNKA